LHGSGGDYSLTRSPLRWRSVTTRRGEAERSENEAMGTQGERVPKKSSPSPCFPGLVWYRIPAFSRLRPYPVKIQPVERQAYPRSSLRERCAGVQLRIPQNAV
jgi:hypothetical protein